MSNTRCHFLVCTGAGCVASGSLLFKDALQKALDKQGLSEECKVVETGCLGPCAVGPVAAVYPDGVFYQNLKPEDAAEIVEEHLLKGRVVSRLLRTEAADGKTVPTLGEISFFQKQQKIVLRNCGVIDPLSIEEYIARDGYSALAKALTEMTPDQVIQEVKKSGLRGRGGAGFPTGLKWELTRKAAGDVKYVLCNADEGDPGAFMDRSVLEGDPHSVIEGMAIAGYAIGASQGFVYVRAEYPLAVERLGKAIDQARERGLLGQNILGPEIQLRPGNPHGLRRLRLRRGNRPDDLHRGQPRRAAAASAVPGEQGPLGKAEPAQQRRDLREHRADHPPGRGLVRLHRHGKEQRHQGLCPGRQGE